MFDFLLINIIMVMVKNTDPKDLDRRKLRYIFRRVLKRIQDKPNGFFKFRKMRGIRGLWCGGDMIELDYRREIVPTLIHEVLHDLYESNSEKWVYQVESKISQILKPKDVYKLLKSMFSNMDFPKS
jgi:hypothetical protein